MNARLSVVALVAVWLGTGCSCGGHTNFDGGTDAGTDAGVDGGLPDAGAPFDEFDAWRDIQGVIRKSPDAVPARANALVAAQDTQGLFALVRDDIALLPTTDHSLEQAGQIVRWGPRATLRGEAGTPRERADLLAWLYQRAGFTATVVVGTPRPGVTATALLAQGSQRQIDYIPSTEQLAKWHQALPADPKAANLKYTALDADGGVRAAILAQIEPLLPVAPMPTPFDATLAEVPLVQVTIAGAQHYANPNVDGAMFDDSYTVDAPVPADPTVGERTLHVTLEGERSAHPGQRFTLVEHTWLASEVAGRTITTAFTTPLSLGQAAVAKVGDANAFIPMMLVRGEALDSDAGYALSSVGTPVLSDGSLVTAGADGGLVIDGEPISVGPTPAALLTSVSQLTMQVNPAAFPDVELRVSATRSDGHTVSGLGSDAFVIKEDGKNVVAALRRTAAGVPQVVLLFDVSTSIPPEFVTGAPALGHAVAQSLFTQFPGAQVQIGGIDIGGADLAGPMVSTLADVDAQLASLSGAGSSVWSAVDSVSGSRATAIVVITDAVVDDSPTPDLIARLTNGPPVLLAGVGTVDMTSAQQIVTATGGEYLDAPTTSSLPGQVTAFVADRVSYDYRIVYRAPVMGATTRQVTVALTAPGTATTTTPYDPPAVPVAAGKLSALYLTIESDTHSVTRVLATGADVEGALFGRYVLAVEANPPSFTTLLDEQLGDRFQLEAGVKALRANDAAAIREALKNPASFTPSNLRFSQAMLPGESVPTDVTFADGLTATLHSTLPRLGVKTVHRYDLLPLAPHMTVSFNGGEIYRTTLERTAQRAAFESEHFARNTRVALAGKTLARFDSISVEALGPAWAGAAYPTYNDYDIYAPAGGSVVAFWAVHRVTGELIGVLPEGGLGEDESTAALVDRLTNLLDIASRAGAVAGYNGLVAWADLESIKVTLLGGVIELFEGEGTVGDINNNLCSSAADAAGGGIPGYDEANQVLADLARILELLGDLFGDPMPAPTSLGGAACGAVLGN